MTCMAHLLHIEEELRIALNSKFENKLEGQAILIHHASSGFQMTGILGQANDYLSICVKVNFWKRVQSERTLRNVEPT